MMCDIMMSLYKVTLIISTTGGGALEDLIRLGLFHSGASLAKGINKKPQFELFLLML